MAWCTCSSGMLDLDYPTWRDSLCPVGSTKAGIQAALSPQPAAGQIANSAATETADVLPQAERYFFDPVNTGSFPLKPALTKTIDGVHGSQSHTFTPSASAIENAVEQTGKSANDARALEMPIKHNRALPLELFDNPETEVVPPEDRINSRPSGQPGAPARSRFYDSKGGFAWAPCHVIAYDRYPMLVRHVATAFATSLSCCQHAFTVCPVAQLQHRLIVSTCLTASTCSTHNLKRPASSVAAAFMHSTFLTMHFVHVDHRNVSRSSGRTLANRSG